MMTKETNKTKQNLLYRINALKPILPGEYRVLSLSTSHQLGQHCIEHMQIFSLAITIEKIFYVTHLLQKIIVWHLLKNYCVGTV